MVTCDFEIQVKCNTSVAEHTLEQRRGKKVLLAAQRLRKNRGKWGREKKGFFLHHPLNVLISISSIYFYLGYIPIGFLTKHI